MTRACVTHALTNTRAYANTHTHTHKHRAASPKGYSAIMDANGVTTLGKSYEHLAQSGRLIVYGFHTNLPRGVGLLSPLAWASMAVGLLSMPRFDSMQMVLDSKSVLGFNLSFFAEEHELIARYLSQIVGWLESRDLKVAKITPFELSQVAEAHKLIQSGTSTGKLVVSTANSKGKCD